MQLYLYVIWMVLLLQQTVSLDVTTPASILDIAPQLVENKTNLVNAVTSDNTMTTYSAVTQPEAIDWRTKRNIEVQKYRVWKIARQLRKFIPPVLLGIGVLSSFLSIVVLSRPTFLYKTITVYLMALAIVDLIVLLAKSIPSWVYSQPQAPKFQPIPCKIIMFIVVTSMELSSWLVTAVAVERCLLVMSPVRARVFSTRKRAQIVVTVMFFVIVSINIHHLWLWGATKYPNKTLFLDYPCYPNDVNFARYISPYFGMGLQLFLPMLLILCCNSYTIIKLCHKTRSRTSFRIQHHPPTQVVFTWPE